MSLIYGVDNEVLFLFGGVLGVLVLCIFFIVRQLDKDWSRSDVEATSGGRENLDICAICLSTVGYPCETNCGHIFCAECMINYFEQIRARRQIMSCPMCRRDVTMLMRRGWTEEEFRSPEGEQRQAHIRRYNILVNGGTISVMEQIRDLPTMLRSLWRDFRSTRNILTIAFFMYCVKICTAVLLTVLYVVSPLDILPEAIFGVFGFIDDFAAILLVALVVVILYRQRVVRLQREEEQTRLNHAMRATAAAQQ